MWTKRVLQVQASVSPVKSAYSPAWVLLTGTGLCSVLPNSPRPPLCVLYLCDSAERLGFSWASHRDGVLLFLRHCSLEDRYVQGTWECTGVLFSSQFSLFLSFLTVTAVPSLGSMQCQSSCACICESLVRELSFPLMSVNGNSRHWDAAGKELCVHWSLRIQVEVASHGTFGMASPVLSAEFHVGTAVVILSLLALTGWFFHIIAPFLLKPQYCQWWVPYCACPPLPVTSKTWHHCVYLQFILCLWVFYFQLIYFSFPQYLEAYSWLTWRMISVKLCLFGALSDASGATKGWQTPPEDRCATCSPQWLCSCCTTQGFRRTVSSQPGCR